MVSLLQRIILLVQRSPADDIQPGFFKQPLALFYELVDLDWYLGLEGELATFDFQESQRRFDRLAVSLHADGARNTFKLFGLSQSTLENLGIGAVCAFH